MLTTIRPLRPNSNPLLRWIVITAFICALLNGCALLYIPMLIIVPFQPILMIAAKIAARYGPLLLLLVETDPGTPGVPETMIAVSPADFNRATELVLLDTQLESELDNNPGLVAVTLVETAELTEGWLRQQVADARAQGCRVRIVFVDSRKYRSGAQLPADIIRKINGRTLRFTATSGLAWQVAGGAARSAPPGNPVLDDRPTDAGYATLAGALGVQP